jgi:hypothetical protein
MHYQLQETEVFSMVHILECEDTDVLPSVHDFRNARAYRKFALLQQHFDSSF